MQGGNILMKSLITLNLIPGENTLEFVRQLRGLEKLDIDENFGLVMISPKRNLYTIRASGDIDSDKLLSMQPKVKGIYPDVKIAPLKK
jgi:hypothetical protein